MSPNTLPSIIVPDGLLSKLRALLAERGDEYRRCAKLHYSEYSAWCYETPHNRRYMAGYLARETTLNVLGVPFACEVVVDHEGQQSTLCIYIHKELRPYVDQLIDAYNSWIAKNPEADPLAGWRAGLTSYNRRTIAHRDV